MIARIEPVTEGAIRFAGEPIESLWGEPLRQLRRRMQIIVQDPSASFSPRMKIGEFLREPFVNFEGLPKKDALDKAAALLASVDLPAGFMDRYPHQLSGGEQQRVAIARAMALRPLLLVCDEPTSALDVSIQKRIIALLDDTRRSHGIAMLFISHDLALVSNFSERIVVMYLGYILESLSGARLGRDALHPYTKALLQSVFQIGETRGREISVPEGEPPDPAALPAGCPFCPRCPQAGERCRTENPSLREIAPGHHIACHNA
jgi:peptide/nickel transport system ATP-binding protein